MKIIFVADDGTWFDDEYECETYEIKIKLQHNDFDDIEFYDKDNNRIIISNIFDDNIYNLTYKVIIKSEEQFNDFSFLCRYCGWLEMEDIDSPGIWEYIDDTHSEIKFKKII